jgi:putative two-component system response regulator
VSELLRRAAPLHDLGKLAVPDGILLKLDRLTDDEFRVMQTHTQIGAKILSGSKHALLQLAEQIALTHHEHWDGSGYTPGLRGESIPLVSRIVAVVDVFDALTHARPYKPAWPVEEAVAEIERQSGRQFDPIVVEAFMELLEEDGLLKRQPMPRRIAAQRW